MRKIIVYLLVTCWTVSSFQTPAEALRPTPSASQDGARKNLRQELRSDSADAEFSQSLLEAEIQAAGKEIFGGLEKRRKRLTRLNDWRDFFVQYGMQDGLRSRTLAFLNEFPALTTPQAFREAIRRHFPPQEVPRPIAKALRLFEHLPESQKARIVKEAIRFVARRFVAGATFQEALPQLRKLRDRGMTFVLDRVGEAATQDRQTEENVRHTLELIDEVYGEFGGKGEEAHLSIKESSFTSRFDLLHRRDVLHRTARVARVAKRRSIPVTIDMEQYRYKQLTLDIFRELLGEEFADGEKLGVVLQGYLRDSPEDISQMIAFAQKRFAKNRSRTPIRWVKGAYPDQDKPFVWDQKWQTDENYEIQSRRLLDNADSIAPAFGTHNIRSITNVIAYARLKNIPKDAFEFQFLYGMHEGLATRLVRAGYRVRVYVPIGPDEQAIPYLTRRLTENTSQLSFFQQSLSGEYDLEELLKPPREFARPVRNGVSNGARASDGGDRVLSSLNERRVAAQALFRGGRLDEAFQELEVIKESLLAARRDRTLPEALDRHIPAMLADRTYAAFLLIENREFFEASALLDGTEELIRVFQNIPGVGTVTESKGVSHPSIVQNVVATRNNLIAKLREAYKNRDPEARDLMINEWQKVIPFFEAYAGKAGQEVRGKADHVAHVANLVLQTLVRDRVYPVIQQLLPAIQEFHQGYKPLISQRNRTWFKELTSRDGGDKELYQKAIDALREAERSGSGKEPTLERYDSALWYFEKYLEADPDAHHFLTMPFAERGTNHQLSISGGPSMGIQVIRVPDLLQAIQFVLNTPTPTPEKRKEVEEMREELLSFLIATTQLWPMTKERKRPEEIKQLTFIRHPGIRLDGYFFESQDRSRKAYPTVVMLAPFSQSVLVLRGYARFLQENYHVNVFLLEMRHHGESGGQFASLGYLESQDLAWVIEQLVQNPDLRVDAENIIGYGLSIGAQIWLVAENQGLVKPKALVFDTLPLFGRTERGAVDWQIGWDAFSFGVPRRLAPKTMEIHRRVLRYHLSRVGLRLSEEDVFQDPLELLRRVKTSSLILVEHLDRWAPVRRASDTFEALHEAKIRSLPGNPLLLAAGINGDHARGFVDDPGHYRSAVRLFLNRILPQWAIRRDRPDTASRDGAAHKDSTDIRPLLQDIFPHAPTYP